MITFVVTTYNLEDWLLRRCLESIVSQGLERECYEIIVVDDESAIAPQHIVDEFAHRANISLYVQKHSRQGAARNLALHHAKGEWIQFVDGDDYLFPNTINSCLEKAEANGLDLLLFGFRKVGEEFYQPDECDGLSPIISGNEYMQRYNLFGSCCTLLFRRSLCFDECYGEPLFFTEQIYLEDEEFVTCLVWRAQHMARTDRVVYAYYQRSGSTTRNYTREHTDELFRNSFVVLRRLLDFESSLALIHHEGLTRKIRFIAVDVLRRALRDSNWQLRWKDSVRQLRDLGLYPLPSANYSCKYRVFRILASTRIGQMLLRFCEKRMNG